MRKDNLFLKKGYSLIELVLVIGIISILISISVLNFGIIDSYIGKNTVNRFAMDIRRCRNLAIESNYYSTLTYDSSGYNYSCNGNDSEFFDFPKGTSISESTLKFNNRGIPSKDTPRTIVISVKNRDYSISIEHVTGRINTKRKMVIC